MYGYRSVGVGVGVIWISLMVKDDGSEEARGGDA
jgi:hypothetical protein